MRRMYDDLMKFGIKQFSSLEEIFLDLPWDIDDYKKHYFIEKTKQLFGTLCASGFDPEDYVPRFMQGDTGLDMTEQSSWLVLSPPEYVIPTLLNKQNEEGGKPFKMLKKEEKDKYDDWRMAFVAELYLSLSYVSNKSCEEIYSVLDFRAAYELSDPMTGQSPEWFAYFILQEAGEDLKKPIPTLGDFWRYYCH